MATLWSGINKDQIELIDMDDKDDLISFGQGYLASTKDRGDYREMMSLALLLVNAYPAHLPRYHVRTVGGTSNARWMAKVINDMKLVLYRSQFVARGLITEQEAEEHVGYVRFLLRYYVRQWLQCPSVEDAALNDLRLYQDLKRIKPDSPYMKYAAPMLRKLNLHLWYLSEEHAATSLFSNKLSLSEKSLIARAMRKYHSNNDCTTTPDGKLITPIISASTKLWQLIGPRSWLLFHMFGYGIGNRSFIGKNVRCWESDEEYQDLKNIISHFQVVNDPAERGILLAKTLQGKISHCPDERSKLFLCVPYVREKLFKLTKDRLLDFKVNM